MSKWRAIKVEKGQDLIEYALSLPLFLLLIFGIVEAGILIFSYNTLANAAREGARAGVLPVTSGCNNDCRKAEAKDAAERLTTGLNPAALDVTVTRPVAGTIIVQVSYTATLITGPVIEAIGGGSTLGLSTVATMNLE